MTLTIEKPETEARGATNGADLADTLQQIVSRLEIELYGPVQSVTGGRE